jgi:hypothetical protein
MVCFQSANATRLIDPVADAILGYKLLLSSRSAVCQFRTDNNCKAHAIVGGFITAAAAVDFLLCQLLLLPSQEYVRRHQVCQWRIHYLEQGSFRIIGLNGLQCWHHMLSKPAGFFSDSDCDILTIRQPCMRLQRLIETIMMLCEATIFAMSVVLVRYNMEPSLEAYNDLEVYTVMCSLSTFVALGLTVLSILVPKQVCLPCSCIFALTTPP